MCVRCDYVRAIAVAVVGSIIKRYQLSKVIVVITNEDNCLIADDDDDELDTCWCKIYELAHTYIKW